MVDEAFADTPEMQKLNEKVNRVRKQKKLFEKCVFQLGRETPVYILQHIILSHGGSFLLQDQIEEMDEAAAAKVYKKVTHVVMDRPIAAAQLTSAQNKAKEFVQPQYLVDAANNLLLLPTRPYKPGVPAPPHLSPFVDNESAGYVPDRQREINTLAGVATPAAAEVEDSSEEEEEEQASAEEELRGDADSSSESEEEEKEEKEKPKGKAKKVTATKLKKDLEEE